MSVQRTAGLAGARPALADRPDRTGRPSRGTTVNGSIAGRIRGRAIGRVAAQSQVPPPAGPDDRVLPGRAT